MLPRKWFEIVINISQQTFAMRKDAMGPGKWVEINEVVKSKR